ncbi:hypothetical protein [Aquidulcibacter sp.]|uniref:hypothetical protein n=1 Tax=Aquidulcibacter sp. TaxID=2052990 RepID=UPI0025C61FEC|nr:hypothetical protein [Aquidulcibacter sp.]MCA3696814.1 hypothetical protein [Aquidulcibacter sp.]
MIKHAAYLGTLMALGFAATGQAQSVSTYRSDGVTAPQVKAEVRKERPRNVRITRSTDALPPVGGFIDTIEPVGGGVRLAPASTEAEPLPMAILVDVEAQPRQRPQSRKSRLKRPARN